VQPVANNFSPMLDKEALLDEECLIIRTSGEIPEVAFYGSIYYLTSDPAGPQLALADDDICSLAEMVVERYRLIILRDLTPENRRQRIYRGVGRAAVNWQRLRKFCAGRSLSTENLKLELAAALLNFLEQEINEVLLQRLAPSSLNCPPATLALLAGDLGLSPDNLPAGWQALCPPA